MSDAKPERWQDGVNPHVVRSMVIWAATSVIFLVVWLAVAARFEELSPNDPIILWRALAEKVTGFIAGIFAVTGVIRYCELLTNGNLLGRVLQDGVGSGIFLGCVFLGSVLLYVFC